MKKTAIITGVTGQDGAYLAQLLLKKNFKVYGILRRSSLDPLYRLEILKIKDRIEYINLDLSEYLRIIEIIKRIKPKFFFNLAAQSFVKYAYENPIYTDQVNNQSVINILEAIRLFSNKTRFYQASTSEMYGLNERNLKKLDEKSHFNPISPYAIAKLSSYYYVKLYRNSFNLFAANGILFNHESPLRGDQFVTKKIVKGLTEIKFNKKKTPLLLGNIYSRRDWGHAKDYVNMMYKILMHKEADDFVISSEKQYSIKEFINLVCKRLNIPIKWFGKGLKEKAYYNNKVIIQISKKFLRPLDVVFLLGDSTKAKKKLNWKPEKNLNYLIDDMVKFEIKNLIKK